MDCTLKRPGYFPLLAFLLIASAFVATGCGMFDRPVKAEVDQTLQDGSTIKAGDQIYQNDKGETTAHKVDPVTGKLNEKFQAPDPEVGEKQIEQGKGLAGGLPPPFNAIALGILTIGGAGGIAGLRMLRDRKLAAAGIKRRTA